MPDEVELERWRVLGQNIRKAMRMADLTMAQLAARVGVRDHTVISRAISGVRPIRSSFILSRIAQVTGVPYEQLLAGGDAPMTREAPRTGTCTATTTIEHASAGMVVMLALVCDQDEGPGHRVVHTNGKIGWIDLAELAEIEDQADVIMGSRYRRD